MIIKKYIYTHIQAYIHIYFKWKLLTHVNKVYMSSYRQTIWSEWQCKLNFKEQSWQTYNV